MANKKNKISKQICRCMRDDIWNDSFYVICCNGCGSSYHLNCIISDANDLQDMISLYNNDNSPRTNIRLYCGFKPECKTKILTVRYGRVKKIININCNFEGNFLFCSSLSIYLSIYVFYSR